MTLGTGRRALIGVLVAAALAVAAAPAGASSVVYDAQWSFSIGHPDGGYYDFGDAEVSPDGSRFAATAGGDATSNDELYLATTNGPLWVGEPPYDNGLSALPAQPELRCGGKVGKVVSPTWAPDSRRLAYSVDDGVHVIGADDLADCRALPDSVIAPGGSEPDWGPADFDVSKAPSPPVAAAPSAAGPASGPRTAKLALTRVKLTPHAFAAARRGPGVIAARAGAMLRFRLSEPARLTLTVRHAGRHGRKVRGKLKTGRPPRCQRRAPDGPDRPPLARPRALQAADRGARPDAAGARGGDGLVPDRAVGDRWRPPLGAGAAGYGSTAH